MGPISRETSPQRFKSFCFKLTRLAILPTVSDLQVDINNEFVRKRPYGNTIHAYVYVERKRARRLSGVFPWISVCFSLQVDLMYGKGFDLQGELLDLGCDVGLLSKSGAW